MVTLIRILVVILVVVVVVTGFGEPCVIGIIVVVLVVGVLKLGLVGVVRSRGGGGDLVRLIMMTI